MHTYRNPVWIKPIHELPYSPGMIVPANKITVPKLKVEIAQRRNTLKMKLEKGKTSGMAINKQIRNKP